ncbi:MAG: hypothetical protein KGJ79_05000 [Alphaproteobacteria bacterium]|nr:hypothetical protein [Alphaproteobacteria bacterium]MDE2110478.1 hypothetical protein [Alphaproteobacteria bacterium]MDE2493228.1 hypothetical protein [Alphaproteobacteria bacterium]
MERLQPTSGGTRPPPHSCAVRRIALAFAFGFAAAPTHAVGLDLHGRLEVQDMAAFARADSLDAALGARRRNDMFGNLRVTWEPAWDRWSFALHYVVTIDNGDSVRFARAEAGLFPAPPSTWFNLTNRFFDHGQVSASQSIDRLSLGYTASDFVFRIGRQALTWGSGLVFRPMDLFDPFAPDAIDTEYKLGTDMIYTQFLFGDGSDLQIIAVPRPARKGAAPSSNASSLALHYHATLFGHQTTWLVARDRGDWTTGFGVNGALGEATWNLEFVPTFLARGPMRLSALSNVSDAVTLFDRDATIFVEYFYNGFGVGGGAFDLAALPRDLTDRLVRSQVFNTRRNYLAAGMSLQATPLFTVEPTIIGGLDDASVYAILSTTYSLSDNLNLVAGAQIPVGPSRTEFGGMPLMPGSNTVLAPPTQIYIQLRQYF